MSAISDELVSRWQLSYIDLIADTNSSRVYRCRSGLYPTSVIVKDLKPTGLWEAKGFDFLRWRDGHGAVRLLDRVGDCGLLEDAGSILLSALHAEQGDMAANAVIAHVVKRLHSPGADVPPDTLISMREHFANLFEVAAMIEHPVLSEPLRWAAGLIDQLIRTTTEFKPLHGDIHHENIVSGDGQKWLAIDPQGLVGDPAYDVANVFGNPLNSRDLILNDDRIRQTAAFFGGDLGLAPDRILAFAAAHAGVSVCWSMRDGGLLESDADMNERFALLLKLRPMLAV